MLDMQRFQDVNVFLRRTQMFLDYWIPQNERAKKKKRKEKHSEVENERTK